MKTTSRAIVITGTPGTGKTTIAKQLADSLGAEYLAVGQYIITHRLFSRLDRSRRTRVVDTEASRTSLTRYLTGSKRLLVVDTHHPEGIIQSKLVKLVVVLRCHPRTLEKRLRAKKWSRAKIRENVLAEILDSCMLAAVKYYEPKKVVQVDTTRVSATQSVSMVKAIMKGQRSRKPPTIDWLGRLEREGLLEKYLT